MAGFTPKIRPGEVARLERTLNKIDAGGSPVLLQKWINRQIDRLGDQGFQQWLANRSVEDLGTKLEHRLHRAMLAMLPDEVRAMVFDEAQSVLFQDLIQNGFKPGVDFSRSDDGLMLSDSAKEYLFSHVPDELHAQIMDQCTVKPPDDPWEKLEERLGVPFRANLLLRVDELIEARAPGGVLACWMANINAGVANQVVGNDDDPALILAMLARVKEKHPDLYQQIMAAGEAEEDWSTEQLMDYGIYPLTDVLIAAGGSEDNGEISPNGEGYSRKGLERLALVWRGGEYSVNEVIGLMDKHLGGEQVA